MDGFNVALDLTMFRAVNSLKDLSDSTAALNDRRQIDVMILMMLNKPLYW
jgi:hypothetical protein